MCVILYINIYIYIYFINSNTKNVVQTKSKDRMTCRDPAFCKKKDRRKKEKT